MSLIFFSFFQPLDTKALGLLLLLSFIKQHQKLFISFFCFISLKKIGKKSTVFD